IAAREQRLEQQRAELAKIDRGKLGPDEALDHAILVQQADLLIFQIKELDLYGRSPMTYGELFVVNNYLDRDYAPIAERAERLLAHEEAALVQVPNIQKNLKSPLPKPIIETTIKVYKGYAEYLNNDVPKQLAGVGSPAFQEKLGKTNAA